MKINFLLISGLTCFFATAALAQSRTANTLSDAEKLAIPAGAAQACHADQEKVMNYEVIASRILVNPTESDAAEIAVLTEYAKKKFEVYTDQKNYPELPCSEVLNRFDNLQIFKSIVYQDGTVKLPDGKIIRPKRPLNPSQKAQNGTPAATPATPAQKMKHKPSSSGVKPFRPRTIVNNNID